MYFKHILYNAYQYVLFKDILSFYSVVFLVGKYNKAGVPIYVPAFETIFSSVRHWFLVLFFQGVMS